MGGWIRIARLALPLALLGCIDFDGQTLTFRHDVKNDRLLIFQVYQGIHTTGDGDGNVSRPAKAKTKAAKKAAVSPTAKEIEQLESVVKGQRTFFFGNWITEYDRASCEKSVAEHTAAAASRPANSAASAPRPTELRQRAAELALCQQLLESVKMVNGKFFLNGAKQLSAYQQVTVERVSKVIGLTNAAIDAALAGDSLEKYSPAQRAKLRDFAAKGGRWVELEGNELRVR
ncbi:MAG: hypothetical protein JXR83_17000, partial [Deltaproteobacteria bacterium]|nr:hypothetical protein [Deltaproteobacteria bacterium]